MNKEDKEQLKKELDNLLRLFFQSLIDYEQENKVILYEDDRESEEFVKIFTESEDAFNYHNILQTIKEPEEKTSIADVEIKYMIVQTKIDRDYNLVPQVTITEAYFAVIKDNFKTLKSAKEYSKDMEKGYFIIIEYYD